MLLIDIGSTYTKLVVVDEGSAKVVATASSPTTVWDVGQGFGSALKKIQTRGVAPDLLSRRYASSSAAGGLRMVAVGLVPALTMEAAKRAALGAGAKVVGTFSFKMNRNDRERLLKLAPDMILLAGGTNGGEESTVIHNAHVLAETDLSVPVVMAGNANAAEEVERIFREHGKYLQVAENVMPSINKLNVDPVKEVIRDIFIQRIIVAKGLDKINSYIDGIALPTPLAVLEAAKALEEAAGESVIVIDVGGATTDIHSVADGFPRDARVMFKGLPEPFAKRTVEGDLGVRHNIHSIVEEVGHERFCAGFNGEERKQVDELLTRWADKTETIAEIPFEKEIDFRLAAAAVEIAMNRHCGYIEEVWTPTGKVPVQYGKDLRDVRFVIGTGGPLINTERPRELLKRAFYWTGDPSILKPQEPSILIDKQYVLFSIGLIRQVDADLANRFATQYLSRMEII